MVQPEFLKTRTITTQHRACHVSLHNACARPITADLICLQLFHIQGHHTNSLGGCGTSQNKGWGTCGLHTVHTCMKSTLAAGELYKHTVCQLWLGSVPKTDSILISWYLVKSFELYFYSIPSSVQTNVVLICPFILLHFETCKYSCFLFGW